MILLKNKKSGKVKPYFTKIAKRLLEEKPEEYEKTEVNYTMRPMLEKYSNSQGGDVKRNRSSNTKRKKAYNQATSRLYAEELEDGKFTTLLSKPPIRGKIIDCYYLGYDKIRKVEEMSKEIDKIENTLLPSLKKKLKQEDLSKELEAEYKKNKKALENKLKNLKPSITTSTYKKGRFRILDYEKDENKYLCLLEIVK